MKPRARLSRLLAPICLGASLLGMTLAACSVPEFEFPPPPTSDGTGGDPTTLPPPDPCANKQIDEDTGETDFDCGGACEPCGLGQGCGDNTDCQTDLLCHAGTCVGLGCTNEEQDSNETDVDCGGEDCPACGTDQQCLAPTDCESGVCESGVCLVPACDDQVQNGKETSLDCGGDCEPCAADEPCLVAKDCISGECNDEVCGSECQEGFANCDEQNDNACEINTRTDVENCGFCGNVCDLPNATAECSAGECRIKTDGCAPGFQDCNGEPEDGCEVDLKTNKLNCGACNKVCPDLNGEPSCVAGACEITCTAGFEDCDNKRENGCEINTELSSKNCGACDKVCPAAAGYSAYCKAGECGQTLCAAGKGDCNGDTSDGCEVNVTNDVDNCGGCGVKCEAFNANVACVNSQCVITTCKDTFADCDKGTANGYKTGCEVDLSADTANCGACGKACTVANGTGRCSSASCEVNSCSGTFRDCDGDPKNGCEINVGTNAKNCGGCGAAGSDCTTKYANASSSCVSSACTPPVCNGGYGDCTGGIANGCETNLTNDPAHCGSCVIACATTGAHVSSNECVNSQCNPQCVGAFLSCDGDKPNGCEADTTSDEQNCGGCGTVCSVASSAHVVSNDCMGSTCAPVCSGTYGDCDNSRINGCEVNTATSNSHCGGCNQACSTAASAHVVSNNCSGGSCNPVCNGLYDDCDGNELNGCEKDVSADASNCGVCGKVCQSLHASPNPTCAAGVCNPTCDAGWAKCSNPEQGCATQLGTTSNCLSCGDACTAAKPYCEPSPTGCVDHRDIVVVGSGSAAVGTASQFHNVAGWGGGANVPVELKLTHNLKTATGNTNRMVVVGVAATDTLLADPPTVTVSYNAKPMQLAIQQLDGMKQSYAAIFYVLDAGLPSAAGNYEVVATYNTPGFRWGHAGLDLIELKNTMQVAPIAAAGTPGNTSCSASPGRSGSITFSQAGSLVYGVLGSRGASAATLGASAGLVETWNQVQTSPDRMVGAAAYVIDDDNRTLSWTLTNCYNSAISLVAIKRLNAN